METHSSYRSAGEKGVGNGESINIRILDNDVGIRLSILEHVTFSRVQSFPAEEQKGPVDFARFRGMASVVSPILRSGRVARPLVGLS